jgi:DNA-binding IclR family transcriptional regulator
MRSVAAPVVVDGDVVCSISLAGPANRFVGERIEKEIPNMVRGAANEIELKLTYSESGF